MSLLPIQFEDSRCPEVGPPNHSESWVNSFDGKQTFESRNSTFSRLIDSPRSSSIRVQCRLPVAQRIGEP